MTALFKSAKSQNTEYGINKGSPKPPPTLRGQAASDRRYENTASQGRASCYPSLRQGLPSRDWTPVITSATHPSNQDHRTALPGIHRAAGRPGCGYVQRGFDEHLKCGRLEQGFLRVRCDTCHAEHLAAFSCKRCGFCPSCGARCMVESAACWWMRVFPSSLCANGC